jgi:hypothetical protein
MGWVIDTLYNKMLEIQKNPQLIVDQLLMIDIFKQYQNELPPFGDYWELMFKKKQMKVISAAKLLTMHDYSKTYSHLIGKLIGTQQRGYMSWDQ